MNPVLDDAVKGFKRFTKVTQLSAHLSESAFHALSLFHNLNNK